MHALGSTKRKLPHLGQYIKEITKRMTVVLLYGIQVE